MKKTVAIFLSFILFYTLYINTFATNVINFTEKTDVKGSNVEYSISISENSNVAGFSLTIDYDKSSLELIQSEIGNAFSDTIYKINSAQPGKVLLTSITTTPVTKLGFVIRIKFNVKSSNTKYLKIDYKITECVDSKYNDIQYKDDHITKQNILYHEIATTINSTTNSTTIVQSNSSTSITTDSKSTPSQSTTIVDRTELISSDEKEEEMGGSTTYNTEADTSAQSKEKTEAVESKTQNNTDSNDSNEKTYNSLWIWITATAIVLIIIGLCLFLYNYKNRRKKK